MSEVQFKDSGVDWIGAVPIDWEVTRLKSVSANAETGKRPPDESEEVLSIGGEHVQEGMFYLENPRYVSFGTFKGSKGKIHIGDLLIVKDGATIGKCMYVNTMPEERMLLNEHVYRMGIEKFFYYWIETTGAQFWFRSNNMSTAQESIPQNTLYSLPVVVPRKAMREKISCYLDEKTAAIDGMVAVLEKKLAAYKRLKKSVINLAVTRGLDPNVKLKDSCVDWIGQVPEGWKIKRVKDEYFLKGRIGWQGLKAEEFIDEGPWLITGTDFNKGRVDWNTCYHISNRRYEQDLDLQVREGDLLVTKDGTVGKLAYIDHVPGLCSLNSHLLLMRPINKGVDNRYMYWMLSSCVFRHYIEYESNGSTMQSLSQEAMSRFVYAVPEIGQQQAIADYLDAECAKIDKAEEIVEKQIDAYKRLKRSLINEVVTGKRKVA